MTKDVQFEHKPFHQKSTLVSQLTPIFQFSLMLRLILLLDPTTGEVKDMRSSIGVEESLEALDASDIGIRDTRPLLLRRPGLASLSTKFSFPASSSCSCIISSISATLSSASNNLSKASSAALT